MLRKVGQMREDRKKRICTGSSLKSHNGASAKRGVEREACARGRQ